MHDLMGFYQSFRPWFTKCYIPIILNQFKTYIDSIEDIRYIGTTQRRDGLLVLAELAIEKYVAEVRSGSFPSDDYSYPMTVEQLNDLRTSQYWRIELE